VRLLQRQLGQELERSEQLRRQLEASFLPNKGTAAAPRSHSSSPEHSGVSHAGEDGKSSRHPQQDKPSFDREGRDPKKNDNEMDNKRTNHVNPAAQQEQSKQEADQMQGIERSPPLQGSDAAVAQNTESNSGRRHLQFESHRGDDPLAQSKSTQGRTSNREILGSEPVVMVVTLNMDLKKVGDLQAFKRDVASDVCRALGPGVRSVKVLRLQAGSIIVDLEVTPHAQNSGQDLHQALVEQAKDARSALMTGKYTSKTLAISPPRPRSEADKERARGSDAELEEVSGNGGNSQPPSVSGVSMPISMAQSRSQI
jgi:hypothetical protein